MFSLRFSLLCSLVLLIALPAQAQSTDFVPGYVLTADGDTLRGYVADQIDLLATRSARFRTAPDAEVTVYAPTEIEGYGLDGGRRFVTLLVSPNPDAPAEVLFVRPLVEGEALSLYEFAASLPRTMDEFAMTDRGDPTRYAVQTSEGEVTSLFYMRRVRYDGQMREDADRQYRRALASQFRGCHEQQFSMRRLGWRQSDIVQAVAEYNECMNASYHSSTAVQASRRNDLGIDFGITLLGSSKTITHSRSTSQFNTGSTVVFGGGLVVNVRPHTLPPNLFIPLSFTVSRTQVTDNEWLTCQNTRPTSSCMIAVPRPHDFERVRLGLTYGAAYTYPLSVVSPYLTLGVSHGYHLGGRYYQPNRTFPELEGGYFGEIGFESARFTSVGTVSVGLRYDRTGMGHFMPKLANWASDVTTSSLSATLSVRF